MAGKFEIYKDKAGEFRFRLKSSNGQTVLASEGYSSRSAVRNGIRSVEENSANPKRFEKTETTSGNYRFNLVAGNRQVIGQSQSYKSAPSRDQGVQAVARAAKGAAVVDLTE